MDKLKKYGFIVDEGMFKLKDMFRMGKFAEVHIDLYMNNPYMLLSRARESRVKSLFENNRFILRRKDGTVIMNIALESIENCVIKQYAPSHYQILFEIHNISYKLLVIL